MPLRPRTPSHLGLLNQSSPRCQTDSSPSLTSLWILSHHTTPTPRLLHLGSPLRPQVVIKSRIAKHCLLADHLSDRLTLQEIICFSHIILRFLFIDYYTACWYISPTYTVTIHNITSWAYYSYTTLYTTQVLYV